MPPLEIGPPECVQVIPGFSPGLRGSTGYLACALVQCETGSATYGLRFEACSARQIVHCGSHRITFRVRPFRNVRSGHYFTPMADQGVLTTMRPSFTRRPHPAL